ncbi:hypothetical protein PAXRUDRAFT_31622 [Paxillus rubicundulus Ve08.2h10]|uniref:Unplaced genomic scaffold scaffold_100, whole genome shotgun sequence n=1 Tax=Paxillus rubicundulus Ve08.2h10 TaxID=930991 RepID=A0A0D0EBK0_9AGAM|nr:hypothetical protein PAXRUDRAFT_31622 [Paxillus rubicundulus Ve08.2h10]
MEGGPPKGPLSGPSSTDWRRKRLLHMGGGIRYSLLHDSFDNPDMLLDEGTLLHDSDIGNENYGAIPPGRTSFGWRTHNTLGYRNLLPLPSLAIQHGVIPGHKTPMARSPTSFRSTLNRCISQWSISAYGAPLVRSKSPNSPGDIHIRINGFHIIVTAIGFLTTIVAFLVVCSEQWFFDAKYGYCTTGWWKAMQFFCSEISEPFPSNGATCTDWVHWSDVLRSWDHLRRHSVIESDYLEYVSYTFIEVLWVMISSLLVIYLTVSTSFITHKESGILSSQSDNSNCKHNTSQPKLRVMYYAAGSSIPEIKTILSGFVIHGYLGACTLFMKSFGLALSVGSGLSLGKEAPFVHIASCIGNIISQFNSKYENNEACVAGVAVTFGAPIGDTLFSLEEVSYYFPPKVIFFCAMIATITLKFLDPFGTDKLVLVQVTYDKDWHVYKLILFILLGALGGIHGAYFSKLNYCWSRYVCNGTWLKSHPVVEVILVTLATAILCFLNLYTCMGRTELVYNLFSECQTVDAHSHSGLCVLDPGNLEHIQPVVHRILVAMMMKGSLTVITFGIRLPAGIFIPTLGVGACAGHVVSIAVQHLQWQYPQSDMDCVIPGLYALVGAASALSGVTQTTVSLAVIMFEITNTLTYVVPVMLSILVAKTVADVLEPKGIYDLVIELSQLPYLDHRHKYLWSNFSINDVFQALIDAGHVNSGFPILHPHGDCDSMHMVGYIGTNKLKHALGGSFPCLTTIIVEDADEGVNLQSSNFCRERGLTSSYSSWIGQDTQTDEDHLTLAPLIIQSNLPLELLHQFFVNLGAQYVVITDTDGEYEGVIDKKRWLAFLSELVDKS